MDLGTSLKGDGKRATEIAFLLDLWSGLVALAECQRLKIIKTETNPEILDTIEKIECAFDFGRSRSLTVLETILCYNTRQEVISIVERSKANETLMCGRITFRNAGSL